MNPAPRPAEGAVSWNLTTVCDRRCSYCTQRHKTDRGRAPKPADAFLAAFARLPGRFEFKLSGGEPFMHPDLDRVAAELARAGHRISMVSNFSASRGRLAAFADAAAGRVGVFACSLHLEYVRDDAELREFTDRARWFAGELSRRADAALPRPALCVTTVATRFALPLLPALAARFAAAGLPFKVQPEKQDRDAVPYSPRERELLLSLGGHNRTGALVHAFRGRPCWAGARYFILDDRGVAWRCYPARRLRAEPLGNLLEPGFALFDEARPCMYDACNCTVPIARGMMPRGEGDAPSPEEEP